MDLKIFRILADQPERVFSVDGLTKASGAEVQLMSKRIPDKVAIEMLLLKYAGRLLRYQSAVYNIEETSTGGFKATHKTSFLAIPGTEAAINHNFLTVSNNWLHLPEFLADSGHVNPVTPDDTLATAHSTSKEISPHGSHLIPSTPQPRSGSSPHNAHTNKAASLMHRLPNTLYKSPTWRRKESFCVT